MRSVRYHWWSFVHNCIAHPLLFLTGDSKLVLKFHDWTADWMPIDKP